MLEKDVEWPIATKNLADLLGVPHSRLRGAKFNKDHGLIEGEDIITRPGGPKGGNRWTKTGANKIAAHLHSTEARDFQEKSYLGKIFKAKLENKIITILTKAIEGFTDYEKQFSIGKLKVDLYPMPLT